MYIFDFLSLQQIIERDQVVPLLLQLGIGCKFARLAILCFLRGCRPYRIQLVYNGLKFGVILLFGIAQFLLIPQLSFGRFYSLHNLVKAFLSYVDFSRSSLEI